MYYETKHCIAGKHSLLNAGTKLWASSSRHLSQPSHDAWREAYARQVKVGTGCKAWRRNEHISGVGEFTVLLNG